MAGDGALFSVDTLQCPPLPHTLLPSLPFSTVTKPGWTPGSAIKTPRSAVLPTDTIREQFLTDRGASFHLGYLTTFLAFGWWKLVFC